MVIVWIVVAVVIANAVFAAVLLVRFRAERRAGEAHPRQAGPQLPTIGPTSRPSRRRLT